MTLLGLAEPTERLAALAGPSERDRVTGLPGGVVVVFVRVFRTGVP